MWKFAVSATNCSRTCAPSSPSSSSARTARYDIDTGLPVLITDLNISLHGPGENDAEFNRLVGEFPLHVGDVLDQRAYTRGKEALQRSANERDKNNNNNNTHELII